MVIDPIVLDEVLLNQGSTGHIRDGHLYLCFAGQDTFVKADEKQQTEVFLACEVRAKELALENKYKSLSAHIYASYPHDKQAQDDKWSLSYTAKLKAAGVPRLEAVVVHIIYLVSQGQVLDKLIAEAVDKWPSAVYNHVSGSNKVEREAYATHMLTKLVKIGIRTEWAEACIRVGKAAITEDKEPEFPPFPKI